MPVDNGKFKELKQEIARAVELLKEKHEGANVGEARELLNSAKQAVNKDDFSQALDLVQKAQLAARPTTEYLLGRAKSFETEGDQSYKQADAAKAIELWREALEEYARVRDMASKRNESEVVDAVGRSFERSAVVAGIGDRYRVEGVAARGVFDVNAVARRRVDRHQLVHRVDAVQRSVGCESHRTVRSAAGEQHLVGDDSRKRVDHDEVRSRGGGRNRGIRRIGVHDGPDGVEHTGRPVVIHCGDVLEL